MGFFRGPNIVRDGLVLALDAASPRSYPGSGTTWYDLSGNGNNGTLQSGATVNSEGNVVLDGTDDRVVVPDANGDFDIGTNSFTFSVVMNQGIEDTYYHLFAFDDQSNFSLKAIRSGAAADPYQLYVYQGSGIMFTNSYIVPNTWQFFTLVRDGSSHKLFINGELKDNITATIKSITTSNLYLGWGWATEYSPQSRGPVLMYNRALTTQEVSQNYNAHKSRFGLYKINLCLKTEDG